MKKSETYIQHEKFIYLYRQGKNVGIDLYKELFHEIVYLDLTKNISATNKLMKRIDTLSNHYILFGYADKQTDEGIETGDHSFKGDMFEIFGEIFIKVMGVNKTIAISEYVPNEIDEDYGVDGIGKSEFNSPLTVQFKFRSNPETILKERDIKQFLTQSWKKYGVNINTDNAVLFTSCKGMHYITNDEVFLKSIRTINIDNIKTEIDRNIAFWKKLVEMIDSTLFVELTEEEYMLSLESKINPINSNDN